ncbi:MAG: HAD family phosphatase [Ruminococcus sp.]|nr:HAD family phosphatase [Ruminococcus sp.]
MEHKTRKGVIFDLDGTLLDSTGIWSQIDRQILTYYQREIPQDISEIVRKMSIKESSQYFVREFQLPCTPEQLSRQVSDFADAAYRETLELKPNALELLDFLDERKIPYGIATATYGELAKAALRRLKSWERLSFLLPDQEVGAPNTSPEIFHRGAAKLHLGRRQMIVAEDSLHCLECARAAGFFTVGVQDPASIDDWQQICQTATVTITDLWEMREVF